MFKVSLDPASIQRVEANIKQAFNKVIANKTMLQELGDVITTDIQGQNRSGKSPKTGSKHPGLKDSSIKNRKYLSKYNQTHGAFSANRANVTITGELLDSIESRSPGPGEVTIFAQGDHSAYKGKKGQAISDEIPNETLIKYLKDKGFEVMGVRQSLLPRLRRIVVAYIRRASNTLFRLENSE